MKIVVLFIVMTLFPCPFSLAAPTPTAAAEEVDAIEPGSVEVSGSYDRIAQAILQVGNSTAAEESQGQKSFLRYLDQETSIKIVATAFQNVFSQEEAGQIADFLGTPEGEAGVRIFSRWLLRGEFLKSPVPVELADLWETFQSTSAGLKLFAKVYSLYKEIAIAAVKIGGKVVVKAISSDVGKRAAAGILGALMKSGAFF